MKNHGYIYILTNPSFENYIKIGYATNIEKRLEELNRSECIPFAFRVYATYEVETTLSDKKVHGIIDRFNPHLRSIETFNGKKRVREFYAMTPEEAFSLLQAMAEIHNCTDKLKLVQPTAAEKRMRLLLKKLKKLPVENSFHLKSAIYPRALFWNTLRTVQSPARWLTTVKSNTTAKLCI